MTDPVTPVGVFRQTARTGPAWGVILEQISGSSSGEAPLEGVRDELAVRQLLALYAYALDQCDVDGMMRLYADNCVITNPRGTFSGKEAIRRDFESRVSKDDRRLHLWTNVVVRLSDDLQEGVVTAYFWAMLQRASMAPRCNGGVSADKVVKRDGEWRFRERTTSVDFTTAAVPPVG